MRAVCCYFQVHQPFRLRRYSYFQAGKEHDYFDHDLNQKIMERVATQCYLPANKILKNVIEETKGEFRCALSISGTALEQMSLNVPEALESFRELVDTGSVEILGETYYHSLASLYSWPEFLAQVQMHSAVVKRIFDVTPSVFRNTELIYSDELGALVSKAGFLGVLAEGAETLLNGKDPYKLYKDENSNLPLLLRSYQFSDDIAFRFSNQSWEHHPLTPNKFADSINRLPLDAQIVNLFMDYETFGEHHHVDSGILEFLSEFPRELLKTSGNTFMTPFEAISHFPQRESLTCSEHCSWADTEKDLSAWNGNRMQQSALQRVYDFCSSFEKIQDNEALLSIWRRLQTSDHFYYMSTKWFSDASVHTYFNHFESPYEAFISYMNVLRDFGTNVTRSHYDIAEIFEGPRPL